MPSRFRLCASAHGCASVRPSRALMRQRVASARGATRVSRDSISCVRHSNADLAIGRKGRSSYEERVRHSVCHWGKNCPPLLRARFLLLFFQKSVKLCDSLRSWMYIGIPRRIDRIWAYTVPHQSSRLLASLLKTSKRAPKLLKPPESLLAAQIFRCG